MNKRQRKKRGKKRRELMLQFANGLKMLLEAAKECADLMPRRKTNGKTMLALAIDLHKIRGKTPPSYIFIEAEPIDSDEYPLPKMWFEIPRPKIDYERLRK